MVSLASFVPTTMRALRSQTCSLNTLGGRHNRPELAGPLGKANVLLRIIQLAIDLALAADASLGIDSGECIDALKIENAIARQR
jgi:hypothetical protein